MPGLVLLGFQGFHRLGSWFWLAPGLSSLVTGRWEGGERAFICRVDYYCQGGQITSKIFFKRSERNQDKKKANWPRRFYLLLAIAIITCLSPDENFIAI
ncbi:hypothetical protein BJX65DRAFT_153828 [Aspergillus insuetus]